MEHSYRIASKHRDSAIEISKLYYDRRIKNVTYDYEVGDYVLVDYPHLKKVLSRVTTFNACLNETAVSTASKSTQRV